MQLAGAGVYLKVGNARVCAVEPYLFDQGVAVLDAVVYAQVRVVDVQRADVRPVRHVHPARAVVDPDHVGYGVADVKRARDVVDALVAEGGRRTGGVRRLLGVGRFARQARRAHGGQRGYGGDGQRNGQSGAFQPFQSGHRRLAPPPPRGSLAASSMPGAPDRALITRSATRSRRISGGPAREGKRQESWGGSGGSGAAVPAGRPNSRRQGADVAARARHAAAHLASPFAAPCPPARASRYCTGSGSPSVQAAGSRSVLSTRMPAARSIRPHPAIPCGSGAYLPD